METIWLESFIALCEHESFTRAASAQHVSQPAFSRRIRSLEKWVGTELFDRSTFPVALTDAGVSLRAEAVSITESLSGLRDLLSGQAPTVERSIHVVTSQTLAAHYFPSWWQAVVAGVGSVRCQLTPMDTFDAYDALVNGGCDLLLTHVDPLQPILSGRGRLESITVDTDEFGPYCRVVDGRLIDRLPRPRRRFSTLDCSRAIDVPGANHGSTPRRAEACLPHRRADRSDFCSCAPSSCRSRYRLAACHGGARPDCFGPDPAVREHTVLDSARHPGPPEGGS